MNRSVRVLFFAHPRSGSSSLYHILQAHPRLDILEEPFNENFVHWDAAHTNYRELVHDIPSLDAQLADIFTAYNGLKLLDYQLPADLAVHLLQRPDCQIIFLRRRNLLQAVVSVLIAGQTRLWKKWEMTRPLEEYYQHLQPLDLQDIHQRVTALKQRLDFFESVVDERAQHDVVKLVYEDLYFADTSDQQQLIAAIWKLLEIPPLESERYQYYLQPAAVKLNSSTTYALLPNAREIDEVCGGEITGRLFPA